MAPSVEFWFDFASTYSYPAAVAIEERARQHGCPVIWRPFLLGPIFKRQGWTDSPFNIYPAKGRYMWRDLERLCESLKIPFRKPSEFPRRSVLAARVACAGAGCEWLPGFVRNVYAANFVHTLDIAEPAVLADCLRGLVDDPGVVLGAAEKPDAKDRLRRTTERAIEFGVFGAPMFIVGRELFWGNERLVAALEWCQSRRA